MNRQQLDPGAPARPWSRRRLLITLAGVAFAALCLIVGLVLAVRAAIMAGQSPSGSGGARPASSAAPPADRDARRDALAAAPMLPVSVEDSRRGVPAATAGPALLVPNSTSIGPGKVPAGFPHTPEGAIGQLAAIEQAVLSEMSIARANEVHASWALPRAPGIDQWPLTRHVQSFLAAAGMGQARDVGTTVTVAPVAAQTKALDGTDWTIACVLADVRAVIRTEARIAFGYCERMQWNAGRWMIAPGAPPAPAPSTWPGTELAFSAGWATWARDGQ